MWAVVELTYSWVFFFFSFLGGLVTSCLWVFGFDLEILFFLGHSVILGDKKGFGFVEFEGILGWEMMGF